MSAISKEDQQKILANQEYINKNRETILKEFAPVFCFHKNEDSFPMNADDYVRDVIIAKYNHYSKNQHKMSDKEHEEFADIREYFLDSNGKFMEDYESKPNFKEFQKKLQEDSKLNKSERKYDRFLTFNEKKYGYALGSKVPITGIHPNNKEGKKAPCYTAIIPTPEGFRVKYEYFYSISSAIPGTKWLYNLLPSKLCEKAKNFAVHAGDWEGVEINVKADSAKGTAELSSMQTFAHGRDGARKVDVKDLTLDKDGRACVFVGEQTHPSYADNFVGRSKFMDRVGREYEIIPTEFVNMGPDAKEQELPQFAKAGFRNQGNSSHMRIPSNTNAMDHEEYIEKSKGWERYKPMLFFTKLYNKVKAKIAELFGKKKASTSPKSIKNLKAHAAKQDLEPAGPARGATVSKKQKRGASWKARMEKDAASSQQNPQKGGLQ